MLKVHYITCEKWTYNNRIHSLWKKLNVKEDIKGTQPVSNTKGYIRLAYIHSQNLSLTAFHVQIALPMKVPRGRNPFFHSFP